MTSLVISLDFEMFWGVSDTQNLGGYGANVLGEWEAIPQILKLFRAYEVKATWATIGMLMCRDYDHWCSIRPTDGPGYLNQRCSTYTLGALAQANPRMFFGRPLVEQILQTTGQELAGHSYSHFYCSEPGSTAEQFSADLSCAQEVASDLGIKLHSFVFPRNQIREDCLTVLANHGYGVFRGNPQHWLYSGGHDVSGGLFSRGVRLVDSYIPISNIIARSEQKVGVVNCPASYFLRPWAEQYSIFESLRLRRLKDAMLAAAQSDGIFHIWWHPHNFGRNIQQNLAVLESLLRHYRVLRDQYGMSSLCMGDFISKAH
jgi:peptidoglycan/xylan/chitin deacetylase (PgdA/CDA1 family)